MEKRQSVWKFVPVGTVIGCAILVVMAFLPPMHLLTIIVALVVIGYTAIRYLSLLGDAEEKIRALKGPGKAEQGPAPGPKFSGSSARRA